MGRRNLILDSNSPYHVTARSNNKDWFSIPLNECWNIFEDELVKTTEKYRIHVHAFVLMANHFHLLVSTPSENLGKAMRYFMTETSRRIARKCGRINHIYGARYKWSWLAGNYELAYTYKYVLRNPVKAGICDRVEDYRFSTLYQLHSHIIGIPISERLEWNFLPKTLEDRLNWLNTKTNKEERLISFALRRTKFSFSQDKKVQLKLKLLEKTYLPDSIQG